MMQYFTTIFQTHQRNILLVLFLGFGTALWSQQGIGTSTPHPNSALDIQSVDKGLFFPRIILTASNTLSPIATTPDTSFNGMLVYNTNTATNTGLTGEGIYVWNGTQNDGTGGSWKKVGSGGKFVDGEDPLEAVYTEGHVGIGTTTPSVMLDVYGEGDFQSVYIGDSSAVSATISQHTTTVIDDLDWALDQGQEHWYLNRLSDNQTLRSGGNRFVIEDSGNVGIGTATPNDDAILDLGDINNKGMLIPKVSLTGSGTLSLDSGNATQNHNGMLVYNTNTATNTGLTGVGIYVWNGTQGDGTGGSWKKIGSEAGGLTDDDEDTYIAVEETTDEDIIRFYTGNASNTATNYFSMDGHTLVVSNTGNSVFIGEDAGLNDDLTNNSNVGVGYQSLLENTTGANLTAVGHQALHKNLSGDANTAIGVGALHENTTGDYNTAIGYTALRDNTTGDGNSGLAYGALRTNTTGNNNTGVGQLALSEITTGSDNTALGKSAGVYIADGVTALTQVSSSTYLGSFITAGADNVVNETVIGASARGIGSNTVVLGNDNVGITALKGNVGIGTTTPTAALDIVNDNNGVLFPRVTLTASATYGLDVSTTGTVSPIHNGMLVYNTNTATNTGLTGEGVYVWNGTQNDGTGGSWKKVGSGGKFVDGEDPLEAVYTEGHVGIGTTTPSVMLDVYGEGDFQSVYIGDSSAVSATISQHTTTVIDDLDWALDAGNNHWYLNRLSDNTTLRTGTEQFVIDDTGKVGIGTATINAAAKLDVNGDVYANGVQLTSDARYKTEVRPVVEALEIVLQLQGVSHAWVKELVNGREFPQGRTLGFIAQELEKHLPELVSTDQNGYKSVDYSKISVLLVEALKAQQTQIDAQEKRLKKIEDQLGIEN